MATADEDKFPPPGVGESIGRRGEDVAKSQKEPGRVDAGTDDAGRPIAGATQRLNTGIDPKDPVAEDSPNAPTS